MRVWSLGAFLPVDEIGKHTFGPAGPRKHIKCGRRFGTRISVDVQSLTKSKPIFDQDMCECSM